MTVLSPVGVGREANLWPDPRWEVQAGCLPRTRLAYSSPGGGTCRSWQLGGRYCTYSWGCCSEGWPTPSQQGKVLGEQTEPGMGSVEWEFLEALGPASSSAGGTTAPGLGHSGRARLDKE